MTLVISLVTGLATILFERSEGLLAVAGLAVAVFILPASAYWIFVLCFGHEVWPLPTATWELSRDEKASVLLEEATKLESGGRVKEALEKYQKVVEKFGGTTASHDAQKSLESLRMKIEQ